MAKENQKAITLRREESSSMADGADLKGDE